MDNPSPRKALISAEALGGLRNSRRQILDGVADKVPEGLVQATTLAAVKLNQGKVVPEEVLSQRVCTLVRARLMALSQQKWKSETGLLLHRRRG